MLILVSANKSLKRAKYVSTQEENSHATHDSFGGFCYTESLILQIRIKQSRSVLSNIDNTAYFTL